MRKHWRYLQYILAHKALVYIYGRRLGIGRWQCLIHDWSKFRPSEWRAYTDYFYTARAIGAEASFSQEREFEVAWNHHQKRNPHHWQYWLMLTESSVPVFLLMPDRYVREMLADWMSAGAVQGVPGDVHHWYASHRDDIQLHPESRARLEVLLDTYDGYARLRTRPQAARVAQD